MYIEYIDTHSKFSEAERVIDIQKGNRYKWCGRNSSRPPTEKEEIRRWYHAVSVFSWPFLTLHELGWAWVLVGLPWFLYQLLSRGWFRNRSIPHISTPATWKWMQAHDFSWDFQQGVGDAWPVPSCWAVSSWEDSHMRSPYENAVVVGLASGFLVSFRLFQRPPPQKMKKKMISHPPLQSLPWPSVGLFLGDDR